MGTNEVILQKVQAGLESTRGTNVAATRIVYARLAGQYDRPLAAFMDTSGTYESRRRPAYGREKVAFTATDLCTYEDLPWWYQMAIKGGVVGSGDAGSPVAYTYAFVPSLATDDLKSATLEFNETGNPYESAQVMIDSWTLRGDADNDSEPGWMFEANMKARDWATTTYTGALSDRTTEVILARGTKIYIDDAGGTIGTTQLTGKLINWSVTVQNNIVFKAFAEDVTYVAANKVGRKDRFMDAQFTFEFDSDTEFAKFRSTTAAQRMIRLEQSGTQIHSGPTVNKRLRVDLYGYYSAISFGDRDGNLTATFSLMGFYDTTATKTFSAEVVNALSALP